MKNPKFQTLLFSTAGVALVFIGGTTTTAPITVTNGRFRVPRIADQNSVGAN